ncbi:hypothetical protein MTR67_016293 [Solanum verrucosum]|uniref:Uncharacterized protein n=1 Tax=Solanum verrucosum TaxID=315347 RepID=A0AAF0QI55_SOLVR|nr:hypothetical protein MTR67_016293 [Solanum verrucosum]
MPTAQLPKGITQSYEFGIEQIWRRWKDPSKSFPNITGITPNSSCARSYDRLKLTKNSPFSILN